MALTVRAQLYFWGAAALVFIGFLWVFSNMLTPFVLGLAIAYLLNPLVKRFSKKGIKRTTASALIIFLFFFSVTLIIALVAPVVAKESSQLIEAMPDYMDKLFDMIQPYTTWFQQSFGEGYITDAKTFIKDNVSKILAVSGGVAGGLAAGGQAVAGMMTTLVLTPLVAFYMMREWPAMTGWVEDLIPRKKEKMIKDLMHQINIKVSGFIRGQITVAFILAIMYAVALTIAGLNYGFLIGIGAGILSIIPLVGSTVGLIVSVAVAWFQSGELSYVGIIAAIFIIGQIIEGNIISPKLLGDSVGLHPLWIIFALMAGGSLFGILGMLVAVPVAAVVGVLVSFAILQYKKSPLYKQPPAKKTADQTQKKTTKKKA